MQKTISISLGQTHFYLEEDAYARLSDYIASVKKKFSSYPDGEEIAADIEGRMAERLSKLRGEDRDRVIRLSEVDELIRSMGEPEEMAGGAPGVSPGTAAVEKKLYRDTENAVFGGVSSGLAAYLGLEPVLIRVAFVLLALANGFGILLYFILWIAMPEAKTATEKLSMTGRPVTLESVDQMMKQAGEKLRDPAVANAVQTPFRVLGRAFEVFFRNVIPVIGKILGILVSIIAGFAIFALTLAFVIALANARSSFVEFPFADAISGPLLYVLLFAGYFTAFVPLAFIAGLGSVLTRGWDQKRTRWSLGLLGLWFAAVLVLSVSLTWAVPRYQEFVATSPEYRTVSRSLDLRDFSRIEARNGIAVELREGPEYAVAAEGRARDLDRLAASVDEGTLSLDRDRSGRPRVCIFCDDAGRIRVRVTAPSVTRVEGENLFALTTERLSSAEFEAVLRNGSHADLRFGTSTRALRLTLENGSAVQVLEGSTELLSSRLVNGTDLRASNFEAKQAEISAENGSRARVWASGALRATAMNGSYVGYRGEPALDYTERNASRVEKLAAP